MINNIFLTSTSNEFSKLDNFDKDLFLQILENQPTTIDFWIKDICKDYGRKGIRIDTRSFIHETKQFKEYIEISDIELKNSLEKLKDSLVPVTNF